MLNLTAYTYNGATDTVLLERTKLSHVHVEYTPKFEEYDIEKITLDGPFASVDALEVYFERRCTPEHPFYVRWINDKGGYNYQMFEERHTTTYEVDNLEKFEPYIKNTTMTDRTTETIAMSASKTIKVGADGLPKERFDILRKLACSPFIEYFHVRLNRWEGINLADSQSNAWLSDTPTGLIEYTFELPRPLIQF